MADYDVLSNRICQMEDKINKIDGNVDKIFGILTDFILEVKTGYYTKKEIQENYARKRSEKVLSGMIGVILTTVLGSILFLVIRQG